MDISDCQSIPRERILADMEREIETAIERAFTRLDALAASDELTASPSPDERSPQRPD